MSRLWSGAARAVLACGLLLGTLSAPGVALAVHVGPVGSYNTFNDCYYYVQAEYDTDSPYGRVVGGDDFCANYCYVTAYFWNGSGFTPFTPSCHQTVLYPYYTTNVYGYAQIRKPAGSWSPTIEAHAN